MWAFTKGSSLCVCVVCVCVCGCSWDPPGILVWLSWGGVQRFPKLALSFYSCKY